MNPMMANLRLFPLSCALFGPNGFIGLPTWVKVLLTILAIICLRALYDLFISIRNLYIYIDKGDYTMCYEMKQPYFFCGRDLSDCPTKQQFIKLLSKKVFKKTHINPIGLKAETWDNSHSQYVIAQLVITDNNAETVQSSLKGIEQWFWDPKNQMLKFQPK